MAPERKYTDEDPQRIINIKSQTYQKTRYQTDPEFRARIVAKRQAYRNKCKEEGKKLPTYKKSKKSKVQLTIEVPSIIDKLSISPTTMSSENLNEFIESSCEEDSDRSYYADCPNNKKNKEYRKK